MEDMLYFGKFFLMRLLFIFLEKIPSKKGGSIAKYT